MTDILVFLVAGVALVLIIEAVAHRTKLPAAALLTVAGLVYALLPGTNIELDPHVVLTFILPPLLYSAALNSSLLAIRKNLRPVISLSVFLVLLTALLVGVGVHLVVPSITLAAGIALGAAVAPPDPVAALAIGRRAGLPPRLITLIEGEGLLNDATALTTFTVAVAAVTGGFSAGAFGLEFVIAAAGGLAVGILVALAVRLLRSRLDEPLVVNSISLVTPFAAYLIGEEIHVSGVLAVVVAGLIIGHDSPRFSSGPSRLQSTAVWRLIDFLLEGFVFLLIGQQLPAVLEGLNDYATSTIVAAVGVTLAVVLLLRPLWLTVTQLLPRRLHTRLGGGGGLGDGRLGGREVVIMTWSGTRGVITLAAIFSLPLTLDGGLPFPGRDLLQLCAYVVVLVTLVGQGLTFAPVVRATGLRADAAGEALERNEVRIAAAQAGLHRLSQLEEQDAVGDDAAQALRLNLEHRMDRYQHRLDMLGDAENGEIPTSSHYEAALNARRAVIEAQREELLRRRDAGQLTDAGLRILERELDLEEITLPRRD